MKIKHYRAADMRQALRQVRDAQGPDAVILSSRRVSGGVEVVAAIDYEVESRAKRSVAFVGRRAYGRAQSLPVPTAADYAALAQRFEPQRASTTSRVTSQVDVNEELRILRRMLETQLATLAWNDLSRRAPVQTELLKSADACSVSRTISPASW